MKRELTQLEQQVRSLELKKRQMGQAARMVKADRRLMNPTLSVRDKEVHHANGNQVITSVAGKKAMAGRYVKCLVSPYDFSTRYPDCYGNKSTLVRSRRVFNVSASSDSDGRFAFFVQPKLGSLYQPQNYQIGLVDESLNPLPDTSSSSAYVEPDVYSVDETVRILTEQKSKTLGLSATGNQPLTSPAGNLTPFTPASTGGKPITFRFPYTYTPSVIDGSTYYSKLTVDPGTYIMTIDTTTTSNTTVNIPIYPYVVDIASPGTTYPAQMLVINEDGAGTAAQSSVWIVDVTDKQMIIFRINGTAPAWQINRNRMVLVSAATNLFPNSANYGSIERLRPVACSVLATNILPSLNYGGTIMSAVTPSGSADKIFKPYSGDRWDQTQKMSVMNDTYQGPLRDGTYVWWKPTDQEDSFFREIPEHNAREFSMLLVSGKVSGLEAATTIPVLQVTVEMVFELYQNTQLFDKKKEIVDADIIAPANATLSMIKQCTQNKEHTDLIHDVGNIIKEVIGVGAVAAALFL